MRTLAQGSERGASAHGRPPAKPTPVDSPAASRSGENSREMRASTARAFLRPGDGRSRAASAVSPAVDESHGLPRAVDRRALVVDETGREPDLLHRFEVEVALDARCLLRPRDPQA